MDAGANGLTTKTMIGFRFGAASAMCGKRFTFLPPFSLPYIFSHA
jgi:hypothetical protein